MSYPVFQVPAGDVLPILFSTFDGGTGASITLTGLAVTDINIYKDGSVTQRASTVGYTLLDTDGIDFDAITGIHGFSIDTGDNTDAGFYTVGSWFTVVVSSVTVDGQTVNFIAAQFRLMPAESIAGKPKVDVDAWLGTAAATPTVAGVPEVDLTHVAGATTNVSALATNVAAILADTGTDGVVVAAASKTGYSLTATTGLGNQTADITGNLSGSVGSVTGLTAANLDVAVSTRATPAQILTTALTESYAADGVAPTLSQLLFLIQQSIGDFSISGTTLTVKKLDGTTTAATYTLDSATDPTSRTRAT